MRVIRKNEAVLAPRSTFSTSLKDDISLAVRVHFSQCDAAYVKLHIPYHPLLLVPLSFLQSVSLSCPFLSAKGTHRESSAAHG
jgi:hypothetical protein